MIAPEVSRALSRRVMMSRSAAAHAPTTGSSAAHLHGAPHGTNLHTTPPKPSNTSTRTPPRRTRPPPGRAPRIARAPHAPQAGNRADPGRPGHAVFAGVGGVGIPPGPAGAPWSWAALLPVDGAFAAALRDIITRRLSARETSGAIMFYSMALMVACASLSAPFGWRWPDPLDLLLFLAVGFLVGGAHTLMIE